MQKIAHRVSRSLRFWYSLFSLDIILTYHRFASLKFEGEDQLLIERGAEVVEGEEEESSDEDEEDEESSDDDEDVSLGSEDTDSGAEKPKKKQKKQKI